MTVTANVFSKLAPMVIEPAFTFGSMAADVHTQRIALFLATIKSRFFTGQSEVLPCPVTFAIVACSQSKGKAIGRSIVRNAVNKLRKKIGANVTENIRIESDGLRTKTRVLSLILAHSSGFKLKAMQ
jgi:hypothetical protein